MRDSAPAKDINHPRLGTSEFLKIKPTKSTVITVQIHGTRERCRRVNSWRDLSSTVLGMKKGVGGRMKF
jgi:hypothetical protein